MDLGFIENKTYDEISVGDTARAEHVLTTEDAMAWASISGWTAVLDSDGTTDRPMSSRLPTGANMWCASLISGLFATKIPGPGCTLTSVSLEFHNRILVGERIHVQVEVTAKDDSTKRVTFSCEASNDSRTSLFSGTAQLIAPVEKQRVSTLPVPQLIVSPHRHHLGFIARATSRPAVKTAVVWPCDELSLEGAVQAYKDGLIVPVLVGSEATIRNIAGTLQLDLGSIQIVDIDTSRAAAIRAVEMARKGEVQMLMKGSLHSDELMRAVDSREGGLRTGRRLSHVFALDVPSYHKTLFVTDAAVNIQTDLETKIDILQNAIDMMVKLEVVNPKVAILSSVESVSPTIPSTLDAAALCKMVERGQITSAIVDGPLAFDDAISSEAAQIKKIKSPVAGDPDLLLVPNLEAGNILFKELQYLAGALAAGVVVGAKVPVVLTGRADGEEARMASCALGVLLAKPAPSLGD